MNSVRSLYAAALTGHENSKKDFSHRNRFLAFDVAIEGLKQVSLL